MIRFVLDCNKSFRIITSNPKIAKTAENGRKNHEFEFSVIAIIAITTNNSINVKYFLPVFIFSPC